MGSNRHLPRPYRPDRPGAEAGGKLLARGNDMAIGQVRISRHHVQRAMTQHLCDLHQRDTTHNEVRGGGVAQVVPMKISQPGGPSRRYPRSVQVC